MRRHITKRDARLLPTPGTWVVASGAVYSEDGKSLLLADRNNPQTWPTERDANVKLAADAVNLLRSIAERFGPIVDSDEPWQGSDAVDDFCQLVRDAKRVLRATT
jgi:hypothetical protein